MKDEMKFNIVVKLRLMDSCPSQMHRIYEPFVFRQHSKPMLWHFSITFRYSIGFTLWWDWSTS